MLVEARILRRATKAYLRNSGSLLELAQALHMPRRKAQSFVDGRYHWVTPMTTQRILGLLDQRSREYVEANLRVYPTITGKIPVSVISPVVREAIEEEGSITGLAHLTGIQQRRIDALLHGRELAVGVAVADKIVSRSLGAERWQEDDLRRWYYATTVLSATNATGITQRAGARRATRPET